MRNVRVLTRTNSVNNDIEQVRRAIPSIILDMSPGTGCGRLDDMFHNYSKEWDEKLGKWKDRPLHDEWSNPADSVRIMVMARYSHVSSDRKVRGTGKKRSRGGMAL